MSTMTHLSHFTSRYSTKPIAAFHMPAQRPTVTEPSGPALITMPILPEGLETCRSGRLALRFTSVAPANNARKAVKLAAFGFALPPTVLPSTTLTHLFWHVLSPSTLALLTLRSEYTRPYLSACLA